VPWTNTKYLIYRFDNAAGNFVLIDSSSAQAYDDEGLANDSIFCYKIESAGAYSGTGLVNPIINFSQEKCETPVDNIKPCAPAAVSINAKCNLETATISWSKPDVICGDDVIKYYIYFSNSLNGEPHIIAEISSGDSLSFVQTGVFNIPGCYYIVSVDSVGNESAFSQQVCADNCPVYNLPNVFTPNDDDKNDLLIPFPYRFVESIELTIYNRWGTLVFKTKDKDVNWKGTVDNKNKKLSDGTYYYVCTVNEIYLAGLKPRTFHGFVELIGNKK
jgi:gliding motility-associated-like protein